MSRGTTRSWKQCLPANSPQRVNDRQLKQAVHRKGFMAVNFRPELSSSDRILARSLLREALSIPPEPMPTPPPPNHNTRWTRKSVFQAARLFVEIHGRLPSHREWEQASRHDLPSRATVQLQWEKLSTLHEAVRDSLRKGA